MLSKNKIARLCFFAKKIKILKLNIQCPSFWAFLISKMAHHSHFFVIKKADIFLASFSIKLYNLFRKQGK